MVHLPLTASSTRSLRRIYPRNGIFCPLWYFVQRGRGQKVFGHVVARKAVLRSSYTQGMVDGCTTDHRAVAQDLCVDIPALTHVYERLPTLQHEGLKQTA